jgi:O-methyltransferase
VLKRQLVRILDTQASKLPFSFQYIFFLPLIYAVKTLGAVRFETARFMNISVSYLKYNKINGHYAEFGVYKGEATLEVFRAARMAELEMDFYLFDSFEGLPVIIESQAHEPFRTGEFANSLQNFETRIKKSKMDLNRVKIIEGFFSESLKEFKYENVKFAFVFVDCDLKESTTEVLSFISDKLAQGAILAFDDYYCYGGPEVGERGAINQWLGLNPHFELTEYNNFHWAGKSFIFYDKSKTV